MAEQTSDKWGYTEAPATGTVAEWERSWRQEIFTDLGSNFAIVAHMERIKTVGADGVVRTQLTPVTRSLSGLTGDQLTKAIQIQALLTELIGIWKMEDEEARKPVVVQEAGDK